jgi:ATP-dependent Lhr-like helicase
MPYAFLDPEDAAARRTRAVSTRGNVPSRLPEAPGRIDPAAINTVRTQLWPDLRDEHELHDLLLQLIAIPIPILESSGAPFFSGAPFMTMASSSSWVGSLSATPANTQHWSLFFDRLAQQGRAHLVTLDEDPTQQCAPLQAWIATERLPEAALLWPSIELSSRPERSRFCERAVERPAVPLAPTVQPEDRRGPGTPRLQPRVSQPSQENGALAPEVCSPQSGEMRSRDTATLTLTQGWLQLLGPTTSSHLANLTHLLPANILQSLLTMEMQGLALRGIFEHHAPTP